MGKQPVFGDILKAAREAQGLSQEQLSSRSGVAQRNIQYIERNTSNPSYRTILLLTAGLGAELIIGFKPWDKSDEV